MTDERLARYRSGAELAIKNCPTEDSAVFYDMLKLVEEVERLLKIEKAVRDLEAKNRELERVTEMLRTDLDLRDAKDGITT